MPAAAKSFSERLDKEIKERAETRDLLDEIETTLENWEGDIRNVLELDLSVPRVYGSQALKAMHAFDSEALSLIPAVRRGCRGASRPALETLIATLRLGLLMGLSQEEPYLYHHDRFKYENKPDIERGQKIRHGGSLGAEARWRDRNYETQERATKRVLHLHATNPHRSKSDICRQVGNELKKSRRQIQRYTAAISWRLHAVKVRPE